MHASGEGRGFARGMVFSGQNGRGEDGRVRAVRPAGRSTVRSYPIALAALLTAAPAAAEELGFHPGEEITFDVEWLGVRTGYAKITVGKPQGNLWPVTCVGRTEGIASLVNIQEHLVAYWDARNRNNRGWDLAAVEMNDRHFDSVRYDRDAGKATVRIMRKNKRTERVHDVPKDVQDVAGALLYLRLLPLKDGERHEIP